MIVDGRTALSTDTLAAGMQKALQVRVLTKVDTISPEKYGELRYN